MSQIVPKSEDVKALSTRIAVVVPGAEKVPMEVRRGVAQLALIHDLDPFMGEIMAIKTKRGYVPYVGIDGHRRAARSQINYQRVLVPLVDHWAQEYYHMSAEELRQSMELKAQDMVWLCALYVEGWERPVVELGVCGPSFTTISVAPKFSANCFVEVVPQIAAVIVSLLSIQARAN